MSVAMAGALSSSCIFCQIARASTSTTILHQDIKVVAFQDIKPAALKHYLVIPVEHIPTTKQLRRRSEDFALVSHMLDVGRTLLQRDEPDAEQYRFGFHQPPFNSVNHLHLHCFALPYIPRWKAMKYMSLGAVCRVHRGREVAGEDKAIVFALRDSINGFSASFIW